MLCETAEKFIRVAYLWRRRSVSSGGSTWNCNDVHSQESWQHCCWETTLFQQTAFLWVWVDNVVGSSENFRATINLLSEFPFVVCVNCTGGHSNNGSFFQVHGCNLIYMYMKFWARVIQSLLEFSSRFTIYKRPEWRETF